MNEKIKLLEQEIEEKKKLLQKEVDRYKKRKGVLKEGEFLCLTIKPEDSKEECNVIFFRSVAGVVCMNGYFDWFSDYIYDLLSQEPYFEKWNAKKVSMEGAMSILKDELK